MAVLLDEAGASILDEALAVILDEAGAPPAPAVIWRACYCNRWEAQRSLDFNPGVDVNAAIDRAVQDAAENVDGQMKRRFYPSDDVRWHDWPNQGESGGGQYADPWKLRLNDDDMVYMASLSSGGQAIPTTAVFLRPTNNPQKGLPFTHFELDRSQGFSFNGGQTPQNSIAVTGTWGYSADADLVAYLASAAGSTDTTITVTGGALAGPGDLLVLGYGRGAATGSLPYAAGIQPYLGERVLVTDAQPVATGLTQSGGGVTAAEASDQALAVTGAGSLATGEVITLDSEDMLVEKVIGPLATVRRAFNGTTLATHSAATVYAYRQFTVVRAMLGTAAGSYAPGAAVYRHRVPQMVRDLSIAESAGQLLQEGSGYARTVGSGEGAHPAPGIALADKWDEVRTRYGRKGRHRGV